MSVENAISFAALCLLLSVSPGPDSLLVLRVSLNRPGHGASVAAGSAAGSLLWAAAVAVGLARFLATHPGVVSVLHLLGGGYLVYLGLREVLDKSDLLDDAADEHRGSGQASFLKGLISCVFNPKVGLFFLLLAPQYAPDLTITSVLAVGAIDAVVAFAYLTLLAIASSLIFQRITSRRVQRSLRLGSGAAIVAVGAYVIVTAVI